MNFPVKHSTAQVRGMSRPDCAALTCPPPNRKKGCQSSILEAYPWWSKFGWVPQFFGSGVGRGPHPSFPVKHLRRPGCVAARPRAGKFYGNWKRVEGSAPAGGALVFGTGDVVAFELDMEAAHPQRGPQQENLPQSQVESICGFAATDKLFSIFEVFLRALKFQAFSFDMEAAHPRRGQKKVPQIKVNSRLGNAETDKLFQRFYFFRCLRTLKFYVSSFY